MTDQLDDRLNKVDDEASFLSFVDALRADRIEAAKIGIDPLGRDQSGWENHSIEDFLGRAADWARESGFGTSESLHGSNPWRKFAMFLYKGKLKGD